MAKWMGGLAAVIFGLLQAAASQEPGTILFDMDTLRHRPTEVTAKDGTKTPIGAVTLVDGRFGKAAHFTFADNMRSGFMTASLPADPARDSSAGFSFWVKGDGSRSFGGIELIDRSDFKLRYAYCFPIDSTEWRKITVPWADLTPELAGPLVDAKDGYKPSSFGNFWFGKWHFWRDYPAHSYTLDHIALEAKIGRPAPPPAGEPLARLKAKLREKKPVTIVTMGDSLTDVRHWANKDSNWPTMLAKEIQSRFGSEVNLINPAIGGTTLSQNLVLMPRWLADAPGADLVTICFGYNDWDTGVRGERYAEYLRLAIDRIRLATNGETDILLITTCPAHGRWETMRELEHAARDVAAEKKTALADIATEFRKPGSPDKALRQTYWAWDKTHLGPKGHETVMKTVLRAIE